MKGLSGIIFLVKGYMKQAFVLFLLMALISFASVAAIALNQAPKKTSMKNQPQKTVLAASTKGLQGSFIVNVPTNLAKNVTVSGDLGVLGETTITGDLTVNGNYTINAQDGTVTASNILYSVSGGTGISVSGGQNPVITNTGVTSFQSLTGDITLTAGSGITIDGTTISSNVSTSTEDTFKNFVVGGNSVSASGTDDTFEFVEGAGITLTLDKDNKKLTIVNSSGALPSGWTDNGTSVVLTTTTDNVGIGTTSPSEKLHVEGNIFTSGTLTLNSETISDFTGNGLALSSNALTLALNTSSTDTGTTSSPSGLELTSDGISLIRGCNDGFLLKWNDTTKEWACATDDGGTTGIINVEEGDVVVSNNAGTLDFNASDFLLTESPSGEVNVGIDYANSFLTRLNQNETVSGSWTFSSATPLTFSNATPTISITNGSTFSISDGANTLLQIVDTGTSASLTGLHSITADGTITFSGLSSAGVVINDASGVLSTEAALSTTRGGTGLTSYSTGDLLYASGANSLANLSIGSTGQILQVSGGVPTWVDIGAAGINYWTRNAGTLSPLVSTNDILTGSNATSSALVRLPGTSGENGFFNTGGNFGVGDTTPAALFTVGNGDLFQIDSSGSIAQATGLTSSGTIIFSSLNSNNGLVFTNGSGQLNQIAPGTANQLFGISSDGSALEYKNLSTLISAGSGIGVSGTTTLTLTNNGVLSVNGATGAITIANASESGGTITINDASTLAKGIASFDSANFTVTTGNVSIKTDGIGADELAADSVGSSEIATDAVGSDEIQTNAVGSAEIATNAVGDDELASTTVGSGTYGDSAGDGIAYFTVNADGRLTSAGQRAINLATADITGTLGIANGGTGRTTVGSSGTIVYSDGIDYQFTSQGQSGQLLVSGGSGAPTWIDASSVGTNYFQRNLGALSSKITTDDFLLGSAASASALIRLPGTSGENTWFNTGGNFGIGTNNPTNGTLDVVGSIYGSNGLTIAAGTVSLPNGSIDNAELANSSITFAGDTGSSTTALGGTRTIAGGTGITTSESGGTLTINADDATTSTKGIASFDSTYFVVNSGVVGVNDIYLRNTGDTANGDYIYIGSLDLTGSTLKGANALVFEGATDNTFETTFAITDPTADNTITFPNASGEVSLLGQTISNAELENAQLTINTGTGLNGGGIVSLGGTLNLTNTGVTSLAGTTNQISVSGSTGAVTLSLPQNIHTGATPTFAGLTLDGDLSVNSQGDLRLYDSTSSFYTAFQSPENLAGNIVYTLPSDDGSSNYVLVTDGSGTLSWQSVTGVGAGTGDITAVGDVTSGDAFTSAGSGSELYFHNSGFTGRFLIGTLTGNQTYTLPDSTGTICLTSGNCAGVGGNGDVTAVTAGTGLTGGGTSGDITINLGTLTGLTAGDDTLSVDYGSTANTAVEGNTQVTVTVGTGLSGGGTVTLGAGGSINIANTGVTSLAGTTNQISVSGSTGAVTLSLPQNIHTGATPTFADLILGTTTLSSAGISNLTSGASFIGVYDEFSNSDAIKIQGVLADLDAAITGATHDPVTLNLATHDYLSLTGQELTLGGIDISDDTNLSASDGILLTGDALTNTDKGSSQNIFKTISVSGQSDITTDSNTDTLTLAAGSNITITTNAATDTLTIAANDTNTTYSAGNDLDLTGTVFSLQDTLDTVSTINLAGTGTIAGLDALDATSETTIENAIDTLANLASFTLAGDTITDLSGTGLQVAGGVLSTTLGTDIDLTSEVTGVLGVSNGGTGLSTYSTGDLIFASNTDILSSLAIGGEGQVLVVSGGTPTWVDAGSAGINYFQRNDGTLSPLNITDDLLLGGTSTASALARLPGLANENGFFNTGGNFGIGTDQTEFKLTIDNDGGIIAKGTHGAGNSLSTSGAGSRLIWYPKKSAFRIGYVSGTQWDDANIGDYSMGIGHNTIASGTDAIAIGFNASSAGTGTIALGQGTIVSSGSLQGVAIGYNTVTNGDRAISIGNTNLVNGTNAVAIGELNSAGSSNAMALGTYLNANAANAFVLGTGVSSVNKLTNSTASSLAIGFNSTVPTLFVSGGSGAGTYGSVGIGTTSPTGFFEVNGKKKGKALAIFNETGDQNIIAASASGTTVFTLDRSGNVNTTGNLSVSGTTTFGGQAYDWSGATVGNGLILSTDASGALSWLDPGDLPNSNLFQRNLGAISPLNITDDLLLGGTSTASAKFGILGIASDTPIASLSASTGSGLYLSYDGTIQTTLNRTLTLGGDTTGDLILKSRNKTVFQNPTSNLFIGEDVSVSGSGVANIGIGDLSLNSNLSGRYNIALGYSALHDLTSGESNTAIGVFALSDTTTGDGNTAVGYAALQDSVGQRNVAMGFEADTFNSGSNNTVIGYQAGKNAGLHAKSGNVFLGYQAGYNESGSNKLYIENSSSVTPLIYGDFATDALTINGSLTTTGTTTFGGQAYDWSGATVGNGLILSTDASGALSWLDPGDLPNSNLFQRNLGAISPLNITDDLLLGGTSTASALIRLPGLANENGFFNTGGNFGIGTTNPSTNLQIGDEDTSDGTTGQKVITITGNGTGSPEGGEISLQTAADYDGTYNSYNIDVYGDDLRINRYGIGSDFILTNDGDIGIGTINPGSKLDVAGTGYFSGSLTLGSELYIAGLSSSASTTEGTLYYDTDDDQLKVYANGKWQADRSTATVIVAASDTRNKEKADFVADGSGGTDDAATIESAIAALPANGGSVILLEGSYYLSSDIDIADNDIALIGIGHATKLIRQFDDTTANNSGVITIGDGGFTEYKRIVISNLQIDGQKATYTSDDNHGVFVKYKIADIQIKNLWIHDSGGSGIFNHSQSSVAAFTNSLIDNNIIESNTGSGIAVDGATSYITITNNNVRSNTIGIYPRGAYHTVSQNVSYSNSQQGFYTVGFDYSILTGNVSYNNGQDGISISNATSSTISNNTVRNNGTSGSYDGINAASNVDNSTITGNTVHTSTDDGITLAGGDNSVVSSNTVYNNADDGIVVGNVSNRNEIIGNIIHTNSGKGIYTANSDYNQITSNNIYNNTEDGIKLETGTDDNIISNNKLTNNGGASGDFHGIYVTWQANRNQITGNNITDTAGTSTQYAIRVRNQVGTSENNYIADNYYSGPGAASISDEATNTIIAGQRTSGGGFKIQTDNKDGDAALIVNQKGSTNDDIIAASASGTTKFRVDNSGNLLIEGSLSDLSDGTLSINDGLSVTGAGQFAGALTLDSTLSVGSTSTFTGLATFNGGTTIASGQNLTLAGITGNNAILTGTAGTGVVTGVTTDTSGLCLLSGASGPSWETCPAGTGTTQWELSDGTIYSGNTTLDLLLGGTSTDSAKFAVLNMADGTPTASISALTTGTGLSLAGDGSIQSLLNSTLTIGGDTTGNIVLSPLNGAGTVTIDGTLVAKTGRTATVTVAASDSSARAKAQADYVADGTDDDVTIESAISALPAGGGTVHLFEGTYSIGDTAGDGVDITKSNTSLVGTGRATILQRAGNAAAYDGIITIGNGGSTEVNGVRIAGIAIDGNDATYSTTNNAGIYLNRDVNQSRIENNYIYDNASDGIYVYGQINGAVRNIIKGNDISSNSGASAIYLRNADQNVIENNTISSNTGRGIYVYTSTENTISGNIIKSNGSDGIYLYISDKNSITDNISNDNDTGIYLYASSVNAITGNNIYSNTSTGIQLYSSTANSIGNNVLYSNDWAIGLNASYNTAITGNEMYNNTEYGVYSQSSNHITITGNSIKSNGTYGIRLYISNYATITSNTIDTVGASSDGIYIQSSDNNLISNNSLNDTSGSRYAINIDSNSDNTHLSANEITGTGWTQKINDTSTSTTVQQRNQFEIEGTNTTGNLLNVSGESVGKSLFNLNYTGSGQNIFTASSSGTTVFQLADSGNIGVAAGVSINPLSSGTLSIGTANTTTLSLGTATTGTTNVNGGNINFNGNTNIASGYAFTIVSGEAAITGRNSGSANTLRVNNHTSTGNIFLAQDAGTDVFTIADGGNITATGSLTLSSLTTNGGLLYTNGSGTLSQIGAGAAGQCLQSNGGGAPVWGSCDEGASVDTWEVSDGALKAKNTTLDLLVGGSSTDSAKFSVLNMTGSGTPTASISATTTGKGISLMGDGTIQSLLNSTLTIGGNTTGNIALLPGNGSGRVGIGTLTPSFALDMRGTNSTGHLLNITNTSTGNTAYQGLSVSENSDAGQVGRFAYLPSTYSSSGLFGPNRLAIYTGSGATNGILLDTFTNAPIVFGTGGLSSNNERMRITGTGEVGIGTSNPDAFLHVAGSPASGKYLAKFKNTDGTSAYGILISGSTNSTGYPLLNIMDSSETTSYFRVNSGNGNSFFSGDVSIGTTSSLGKLLIEGAPKGKALVNLNYTGTDQNIFTASSSGVTKFTINKDGQLYIADSTAPGTTTNMLYADSGNLYWNGVQLDTAGGTPLFTDNTTYISPNNVTTSEFRIWDGGGLGLGSTTDPGAGNLILGNGTTGGELFLTGKASSASTTEGTLYYDTDDDQLKVYANGKWQADRSTATVIVAASDTRNKEKADFVADGTDDDVTIESAIAALPSTGGSVVLLEGTYSIGDTAGDGVDITKSNVNIVGSGWGTILQRAGTTASLDGVITVGDGGTTEVNGVMIRDLAVDGVKASYTSSNNIGIYFNRDVNRSHVENSYVYAHGGRGIYIYGQINGAVGNIIKNNEVVDGTGEGIYLRSAERNIVQGNEIREFGDAIYLYTSNSNTVSGNIVESNRGAGIYSYISENNSISDNLVQDNSLNGIRINNGGNNSISDNTVYSNTGDGIYLQSSSGNKISGNMTDSNSSEGISLNASSYTSITGNVAVDNISHGIYVQTSDNITIVSNTVESNTVNGIELYISDYATITGNAIHDVGASDDGIFLQASSNNKVSSNTIVDTSGSDAGIEIDSNSDANYLDGNEIAGAGFTSKIKDGGTNTTIQERDQFEIDSGNPTLSGTYNTTGTAHDVYISGNYAYVADDASGLQIIDISNPASPTLEGTYNTSANAYSVSVVGKYAYVADNTSGLNIIDISNPASPTLAGSYDTSGNSTSVFVSGQYAYLADYLMGLRVVDISNPANPTEVDRLGTATGTTLDVYVAGKYAYVADGTAGLRVVDISDPSSISEVGSYDTSGTASGVVVSGKYAYVGDGASGLQIIDVSTPTAPTLVGTYNTAGYASFLSVSGKYAYVADDTSGIQIVDISNPASPTLAGTYDTSGVAYAVTTAGNYAYVADGTSGLQILRIPGIDAPSASIGTVETSTLNVSNDTDIAGNLTVGTGLQVGSGGITSQGQLSITNSQSATASAFIFNNNTGANADALVLKIGATTAGTGNHFASFMNGAGEIIGSIRGNGSGGVSFETNGSDFAEYYKKSDVNEEFEAGDLVCYGVNGGVTKCSTTHPTILGVVSDRAGFVGGGDKANDPNYVLIGIIGQLHVKVTGEIKTGDALTASSTPGVATVADTEGYIIGYALESNNGGKEKVLVSIQSRYHKPLALDMGEKIEEAPEGTPLPTFTDTPEYADIITRLSNHDLELDTLTTQMASNSAQIKSLENRLDNLSLESLLDLSPFATESASFVTIDNSLLVLGTATMGDIAVTDRLSVGNSFTIQNNTINTLGGHDLEVQSLKQGGISFLAGLVTIDVNGKVVIEKDLDVHGVIRAQALSGLDGPLAISGSAELEVLGIKREDEEVISNTTVETKSTAGTLTLKSGLTSLTVQNPKVKEESLIFITAKNSTNKQALYISNQIDGQFTVSLDDALIKDLEFNFLIIE